MGISVRTMAVGVLLMILVGCAGSSPTTPAAATPEPTQMAAAEVTVVTEEAAPAGEQTDAAEPAQVSVINVGIDPAFEPFVFMQDGKLAGFDVDLLNAMAAEADFEVAYVVSPFDEIFSRLENGEYDAAISAITVTDDRKRIVDFTEPYFESGAAPVSFYNPGQGIAIRTDNTTITGTESLTAGVRVGVKQGTTGATFAAESTRADVVPFPDSPDAIAALVAGDVDAVVVDIPVIVGYIKNNPSAGIRITGGPVTDEAYAVAVSKQKPEILALLNDALAAVKESGAYDQIFNRWFGTP